MSNAGRETVDLSLYEVPRNGPVFFFFIAKFKLRQQNLSESVYLLFCLMSEMWSRNLIDLREYLCLEKRSWDAAIGNQTVLVLFIK